MIKKELANKMSINLVFMILFSIICFVFLNVNEVHAESETREYAYVTGYSEDMVDVVDVSNGKIVATLDTGESPNSAAVSPDGSTVYITNRFSDNITMIDADAPGGPEVSGTIELNSKADMVLGATFLPDGSNVYVALSNGKLAVINPDTDQVTNTIDTGLSTAWEIAVTPDGSELYVTSNANRVAIVDIDTEHAEILESDVVNDSPYGIAFNPEGSKVFISGQISKKVTMIHTATREQIGSVDLRSHASGIEVSPDGSKVYVSLYNEGEVEVYDTTDLNLITTIDVGNVPYVIGISADGTNMLVPNFRDGNLSVIDASKHRVTNTIDVNGSPFMIGDFMRPVAIAVGEESDNAGLKSLSLRDGTLSPAFDTDTTSYSASVEHDVYEITVTADVYDSNATVTVNNIMVTSGEASDAISLDTGTNEITVEVTAEDGSTTKEYTVTVTRAGSDNADLSALSLSDGTLSPAFDASTTNYRASVTNDVYNVSVTADVYDKSASLTVNGKAVIRGQASDDIVINVGSNEITVKVTAEDGTTTKEYTIDVTKAARDNDESSSDPQDDENNHEENIVIQVNEEAENDSAQAEVTVENGRKSTKVILDHEKLNERLEQEGDHAIVTIPVHNESDVVTGELNGHMMKNLELKQAVLTVETESAGYTLPAEEIHIDAIAEEIGTDVELEDIQMQVEISKSTEETQQIIENTAGEVGFTIIAPPIDFHVTATYDDRSIEVQRYNRYVERSITISEDVDPAQITTGVVLNTDGTVRHVPTKIMEINGKFYAQINSLTNSSYSVIYHPKTFMDVESHWSEEYVNEMGSRKIIQGMDTETFAPNRDITRAEFAAIVNRALGLPEEGSYEDIFEDVEAIDWYAGAVSSVYESGLIQGYEDGTFRPHQKITREEAMVIISRAMRIADKEAASLQTMAESVFAAFSDQDQLSSWAQPSTALIIENEIVQGDHENNLRPKDSITRAETAAFILRLLQKTDLI